eukprot:TRINITY_DN2710_c0_g3_i2.p1 TRINITY_DN2710_c0_g3~~TRINITY_DN2710_c0_g3_i2.p1  ORF type:complete len:266 (+),score=35.86 TRINITY_DN2710_c0_g3_i2:76-798(+)
MASTHTTLAEVKQGAFVRIDSSFRNFISEGGKFPPEPNRYHLYISYACPWASRCLALYYMKGLEDIIGLSIVHPTWGRTKPEKDEHCGWLFKDPNDPPVSNPLGHGSFDCSACIPDTVNGFKTVRELYEKSEDTLGKYSVPVLWDKKFQTIVNNESAEIMLMFNTEFNQWAKVRSSPIFFQHHIWGVLVVPLFFNHNSITGHMVRLVELGRSILNFCFQTASYSNLLLSESFTRSVSEGP